MEESSFDPRNRVEKKEPMELKKDHPEYMRVKYSLKMALRMVNGSFEHM